MKPAIVRALFIGALSALVTWLLTYLATGPLIWLGTGTLASVWAMFFGLGSFFFFSAGGDKGSLTHKIASTVWGAVMALFGMYLTSVLPEPDEIMPTAAAFGIGVSLALMILGTRIPLMIRGSHMPLLSALPFAVYGYAAALAAYWWQFLWINPRTEPVIVPDMIVLVGSVIAGTILGYVLGYVSGKFAKTVAS